MTARPGNSRSRGYLIAFASTFLWSWAAILIGILNGRFGMPPLVLAFWRELLVAAILLVVLLVGARSRLRLTSRHIPFFILYGLVLALMNALWTRSIELNGAAVSTVLINSSPVFTALIGWRLLGERLSPLKGLAVGLSITGCIFVSGAHDPTLWQRNIGPIAIGLLTGVAFSVYSLMGKVASQRKVDPWTTTLYTFALAALFLFLVQRQGTLLWLSRPLASGAGGWRQAVLGWATMVVLAIGPTLGGYGLYIVSLDHLPTATANLIVTIEPALTALWAFLLLGERLTLIQLLGGGLILAGVVLLRWGERKANRS